MCSLIRRPRASGRRTAGAITYTYYSVYSIVLSAVASLNRLRASGRQTAGASAGRATGVRSGTAAPGRGDASAGRLQSTNRGKLHAGRTRLRAEIVDVAFNPRSRAREEEALQNGQQDRCLCRFCHNVLEGECSDTSAGSPHAALVTRTPCLPLRRRANPVANAPRARERALRLVAQQLITQHAVCARGCVA
jgi:hypothetical protein